MATDLKVYGPFEVPYHTNGGLKHIDKDEKKAFLALLDKEGLSTKQGCYVFALRAARGYCPWYVGMASKTMRQECMAAHALNHYNAALFKGNKGTPVMFFVVPDGSKSKVPQKVCKDIETHLIMNAFFKNQDLRNTQKVTIPEWSIDGVVRASKGKPTKVEQEFKTMLGL